LNAGRAATCIAAHIAAPLLILPTIVITTQEALRTVPLSLRQAAIALGATRRQMVLGHVLPAALPGIVTGTILGLSRAIGETAPLLMVGAAGSILDLPTAYWHELVTRMALEQLALIQIEQGETDGALTALQALQQDQEASATLRSRVAQVIVALGGPPETE